MFDPNLQDGQMVFVGIAMIGIVAMVFYLVRVSSRSAGKPWPLIFVGGYNILLLVLFAFGVMTQESLEGFGFLPLMALTLPWSGLFDFLIVHSSVSDVNLLGGGLADTFSFMFLVHNVLAASVNNAILYLLLKRKQRKDAEIEAWEQARRNSHS